jgi:hypothetical protein
MYLRITSLSVVNVKQTAKAKDLKQNAVKSSL